jgi:hypothetical protein
VNVLPGVTVEIGWEVPVMAAVADSESDAGSGKYCMVTAVAVGCDFHVHGTVGLGMTVVIDRCKIDNRSSVGSAQGMEVVHILVADHGTDCYCRTGSSVQCPEGLGSALYSIG